MGDFESVTETSRLTERMAIAIEPTNKVAREPRGTGVRRRAGVNYNMRL